LLGGYYGLQTTATIVGTGGIAAAAFAPWIVQALFASYGGWRLSRVSL
jgi:predicted permease